MKSLTNLSTARGLLPFCLFVFIFISCQKETRQELPQGEIASAPNNGTQGHLQQAKTFSSAVIISWLNMQLDMLRVPLPTGTGSQSPERCQAYCGLAVYEAVVNGMPAYQSMTGQLNGFPVMPATEPGKAYHWAASANAALAEMNRRLFPTTAQVNKTNMDNLENSLQATFAGEVNATTLQRSIAFGREVATRIFVWAAEDGFSNVNPAYIPPVGPGLWVPTATTPPVSPYASQRRLIVPGVTAGTALTPPPVYSTDPSSAFFAMVKDVYDKSLVLTPDQVAMAIYHRDAPGYPGGGHFISVLLQTLVKAQPSLDLAALAYAKVGLGQHEANVILFTQKYIFNLIRPVTYIQTVMNHPSWTTVIPTPNHPEFPSGHAVNNSSVMTMFTDVFGENFQLTLHTYDYLGLAPRSYNSFYEMGQEMANSRVYGGLHYQSTQTKSIALGTKVAQNILATIKFLKD